MTVVNLPHFLAKTHCYHGCFFFQKIANIGHGRSVIFCHFEKKVTMRAVWFPYFWSFWDTLANFKILGDLRGDGGGEDGGWWLGCQNARRFYDKKSALSVQNGLVRGCPLNLPYSRANFGWQAVGVPRAHVGSQTVGAPWRANSLWAKMRTRTVSI